MVQTTIALRDCPNHYCARGLFRPLPCSGTAPTTTVFGDCSDHLHARGLIRPPPCSGTASDHCHAQGLFRPLLGDHTPRLRVICTHIQSRGIYLDLATRLILHLPASSGTTSVRCTCQCISYRLYDDWILNVTGNSSKTLAPHAYVTY